MASITIVPEEINKVATKVEITLMTIDLYNNLINFDILIKAEDGSVIETKSLSPNQVDFENFINIDSIKQFIIESLCYTVSPI